MNQKHCKIALEHLAEGLTLEQLGEKYGISKQRVSQILISTYARLGCTHKPTAADIGLAIQRRVENSTRDGGLYGTPEWFHRYLEMEREEDQRWDQATRYRNL
jgi:transcriptional regulator with XRE-family HTH domain